MTATRSDLASLMADAANAWLDTLGEEQRALAVGTPPSDDVGDTERRRWFYTPTDHGGLTVHQQSPAQQRAALRLVATGLSEAGYVTVATIMGLENVLDRAEDFRVLFDRTRGRDPGLYYLRVFGEPGGDRAWGWRYGGHHVSLNNLVVGGELVAATPCFLGADPASSPLLGGAVNRPLGRVEDAARELVRSLPPDLRREAVLLDKAPPDLVTANRTRVSAGDNWIPLAGVWRTESFRDAAQQQKMQDLSDSIEEQAAFSETEKEIVALGESPAGVPGSVLSAPQRDQLRTVLDCYTGRVPSAARPVLDDEALDAVHVAWAGPLTDGAPTYYRVQGPGLLLEWDNTQRQANHAHSVWRDPANDFGMDVLAAHRAAAH
ncbi:DUF3500 domain-containing protein [Nocardioidaceae bacterium]|nr:DUF3500 domain-containing protein [Nocardioidaceae bacterium]